MKYDVILTLYYYINIKQVFLDYYHFIAAGPAIDTYFLLSVINLLVIFTIDQLFILQ